MKLYQKLKITKGITAIVGSGGKTTLIKRLAEELSSEGFSVIVTTTTKIYIPDYCSLYAGTKTEDLKKLISANRIVCVGRFFLSRSGKPCSEENETAGFCHYAEQTREKHSNNKTEAQNSSLFQIKTEVKLQKSSIPIEAMKSVADYVLVEADGSKHMPLKAHLPSEPVIPRGCDRTVVVVGIEGIGKPLKDVAHRTDLFSEISGLGIDEIVNEASVARVINTEKPGDIVYISQVKGPDSRKKADTLSALTDIPCVI